MKKLLSLVLALALILSTAAAMADPIEINGSEKRNIKINEAGLNPSADEMIEQNISPTTGRQLDAIEVPDGYVGTAFTLQYKPIMVQISNAGGGVNENSKGEPATAPIRWAACATWPVLRTTDTSEKRARRIAKVRAFMRIGIT